MAIQLVRKGGRVFEVEGSDRQGWSARLLAPAGGWTKPQGDVIAALIEAMAVSFAARAKVAQPVVAPPAPPAQVPVLTLAPAPVPVPTLPPPPPPEKPWWHSQSPLNGAGFPPPPRDVIEVACHAVHSTGIGKNEARALVKRVVEGLTRRVDTVEELLMEVWRRNKV